MREKVIRSRRSDGKGGDDGMGSEGGDGEDVLDGDESDDGEVKKKMMVRMVRKS